MIFSFWEEDHYDFENSIVILGGGYTGLSTAISIKEKNPEQSVIVIDRKFPSLGASTKNAGFSCFGSVTELVEDLNHISEEDCIDLVQMRYKGIESHLRKVGAEKANYKKCGGVEVFKKDILPEKEMVNKCNTIMYEALGIKEYFKYEKQSWFKELNEMAIYQSEEGSINPFTMYESLMSLAAKMKVKFVFGYEIENIDLHNKKLTSVSKAISYSKLCVCINGFAKDLLPHFNLSVVRNQVIVTSEVKGLTWTGVFHYDRGYYYFRRVGNRVLIGGARNLDPDTETTDSFGNTNLIINELKRYLNKNILLENSYTIDYQWSGLLGVGEGKFPIISRLNKDVFLGIKLGGMGVALSGYIGDKLADMMCS